MMPYFYIGLAIAVSWWLVFLIAIGWVDAKARREHSYRLELRDWEEKVQAMRRLQDQEGDA
jgi:hypothetical protein